MIGDKPSWLELFTLIGPIVHNKAGTAYMDVRYIEKRLFGAYRLVTNGGMSIHIIFFFSKYR